MILQDNEMVFDAKRKRYVITNEYVVNELTDLKVVAIDDNDANPSTLPERIIKRACDMLTDYLKANAVSYDSALYMISHNKEYFEDLKRAYLLQLEYFLQVGDTANAVDFNLSQRVSHGAIEILNNDNLFYCVKGNLPDIAEW